MNFLTRKRKAKHCAGLTVMASIYERGQVRPALASLKAGAISFHLVVGIERSTLRDYLRGILVFLRLGH